MLCSVAISDGSVQDHYVKSFAYLLHDAQLAVSHSILFNQLTTLTDSHLPSPITLSWCAYYGLDPGWWKWKWKSVCQRSCWRPTLPNDTWEMQANNNRIMSSRNAGPMACYLATLRSLHSACESSPCEFGSRDVPFKTLCSVQKNPFTSMRRRNTPTPIRAGDHREEGKYKSSEYFNIIRSFAIF